MIYMILLLLNDDTVDRQQHLPITYPVNPVNPVILCKKTRVAVDINSGPKQDRTGST